MDENNRPLSQADINNATSKALRAVEIVLNNELPFSTCPREKKRTKLMREKVKQELAVKFGAVGPSEIK